VDATKRGTAAYFGLTFAISWLGALAVVAPKLLNGQPIGRFDGMMMFPVMLLGPSLSGLLLTLVFERGKGLRDLGLRMVRVRLFPAWWLTLAIPFVLVTGVLRGLEAQVSPAFAPNAFFPGAAFGLLAGFLEEIGWTGFATPRMLQPRNSVAPAIGLGVLWGLWHLPVVDFLGAASPHGASLGLFALAFIAAMTAMRVLIVWAYVNTRSVLLAQLMHASSTAALVVLSPPVAPEQEALWYALYAGALWALVALVLIVFGWRLTRSQQAAPAEPKERAIEA
jgi:membrane protease YdiL (CAAX protease family)